MYEEIFDTRIERRGMYLRALFSEDLADLLLRTLFTGTSEMDYDAVYEQVLDDLHTT